MIKKRNELLDLAWVRWGIHLYKWRLAYVFGAVIAGFCNDRQILRLFVVIIMTSYLLLLAGCLIYIAHLRRLLCMIYTAAGRLPGYKFPIHLRTMSIGELCLYAESVVFEQEYWEEMPENITVSWEQYVQIPKPCGIHHMPKESVRNVISGYVMWWKQALPREGK